MITERQLQVLVQIIDAGAERGAYRGEELASVGAIRNSLVSELEKAKNIPEGAKDVGWNFFYTPKEQECSKTEKDDSETVE